MLFEWAHVKRFKGIHLSRLILMIPNGAYLGADARQRAITMSRLKRTGFKSGVFDYLLPIPCPPLQSPGLWLEMKRRREGVTSDEQLEFMRLMVSLGWVCVIAKGYEHAVRAIEHYLNQVQGKNYATALEHDKAVV